MHTPPARPKRPLRFKAGSSRSTENTDAAIRCFRNSESDRSGCPVSVDETLRRIPAPLPLAPTLLPSLTTCRRRALPAMMSSLDLPCLGSVDELVSDRSNEWMTLLGRMAVSALSRGKALGPFHLRAQGPRSRRAIQPDAADLSRDVRSAVSS